MSPARLFTDGPASPTTFTCLPLVPGHATEYATTDKLARETKNGGDRVSSPDEIADLHTTWLDSEVGARRDRSDDIIKNYLPPVQPASQPQDKCHAERGGEKNKRKLVVRRVSERLASGNSPCRAETAKPYGERKAVQREEKREQQASSCRTEE